LNYYSVFEYAMMAAIVCVLLALGAVFALLLAY
jgi:uncharacterized membrane protein